MNEISAASATGTSRGETSRFRPTAAGWRSPKATSSRRSRWTAEAGHRGHDRRLGSLRPDMELTDTIYIGGFSGMWAVPVSGGASALLGGVDTLANRVGRRWPYLLPGWHGHRLRQRKQLLRGPASRSCSLETGEITEFSQLMAAPLGLIDDQFVYVSPTGGLMAVRWDRSGKRQSGNQSSSTTACWSMRQPESKRRCRDPARWCTSVGGRNSSRCSRAGSRRCHSAHSEPGSYSTPRFSPDGRRVAMG